MSPWPSHQPQFFLIQKQMLANLLSTRSCKFVCPVLYNLLQIRLRFFIWTPGSLRGFEKSHPSFDLFWCGLNGSNFNSSSSSDLTCSLAIKDVGKTHKKLKKLFFLFYHCRAWHPQRLCMFARLLLLLSVFAGEKETERGTDSPRIPPRFHKYSPRSGG